MDGERRKTSGDKEKRGRPSKLLPWAISSEDKPKSVKKRGKCRSHKLAGKRFRMLVKFVEYNANIDPRRKMFSVFNYILEEPGTQVISGEDSSFSVQDRDSGAAALVWDSIRHKNSHAALTATGMFGWTNTPAAPLANIPSFLRTGLVDTQALGHNFWEIPTVDKDQAKKIGENKNGLNLIDGGQVPKCSPSSPTANISIGNSSVELPLQSNAQRTVLATNKPVKPPQ
ncbi:hypothetical protein TURU_017328 [Turdus rufiventris]|nr:hypothetical protein TURU_017328 [Turdus rufiventris]